jgi:hypothetical protein
MYSEEKQNMCVLMIQTVSHTLSDKKHTEEFITPLQYSAKIMDTYSRNLLLSYVPQEKTDDFLHHIQAQKEYINLEPLFYAYEKFQTLRLRWSNNEISHCDIESHYSDTQLGKRILELLNDAQHFIKEMCQDWGEWDENAKFDDSTPPRDDKVYYDRIYNFMPLASIADVGSSFLLARDLDRFPSVGTATDLIKHYSTRNDLAAFRRLLEVRTEQLAKQLSLLESPLKIRMVVR